MISLPRLRLFPSRFRGVFDPTCPRQLANFLDRFDATFTQRTADSNCLLDVFAARPDLRAVFPLGLTPHQREAYATWLFERGRPDLGLSSEEIVSSLLASTEDRSHGLAATWLLTPALQATVPDALTAHGWSKYLQHIATVYRVSERWLRSAQRPRSCATATSGVNILAHFRYPSGLQEEALQYAVAIRARGMHVSLRDAPLGFTRYTPDEDILGPEEYDITIAKLGVCESLDDQYPLAGWHLRSGVWRIAAWSWELSTLPRSLAGQATLADEIWTPSAFCAAAVQEAFPEKIVTPMLPAVSLPGFEKRPRSHFLLPDDRCLFYFAFDIGSVMERKNPLGLLAAFRTAFRADDHAHLAIKVTRGSTRPHDLARLKAAASEVGATIIDEVLPRDELTALLDCCDVYVSLHRAEGFGFTIAEAMLLGKPTLATGYSANVEFMTPATAIAIEHKLVPVGEGLAPYPANALWAEPSVEHAAAMMRWVYENRDEARAMGERAKRELPRLLSPQAAGARIVERLDAIRNFRKAAVA